MKKALLAAAILVLSRSAFAGDEGTAQQLTLVRDGRPNATIFIAETPTPSARLAALELQYHVKKITGACLPITAGDKETPGPRILVGESRRTRQLRIGSDELGPQEYLIQFRDDAMVLFGRDWHDTEANREELGRSTNGNTLASDRVRIDYAKVTGQDADELTLVTLPGLLDDQGTCYATYDFLERFCGVRWYGPTELGVVTPSTSTLAVGGHDIRRSPDLKHRYGQGGSWPIVKAQWDNPTGEQLNLYWRRLRVGGEKWAGNHSIWRQTVASIFNDPEYQAKGRGAGSQLCYTNPKLVQKTAQVARDFFDGRELKAGVKAMGDYFAVVPDDNAAWCECDRCRRLLAISRRDQRGTGFFSNARHSYYVFDFINNVAKEVGKTHPQKFIAALAYASYAYPPDGLPLEPNISVAPCLHTCYGYDNRTTENDQQLFHAWTADRDRPIYLWNYFHHPMEPAVIGKWNCFPCFMPDVVSRNVKRFHASGVRGVFLCGIGQQLDFYLYMQTAIDATTDPNDLIDEFFARYFGAAAEPMKGFYYRIAEINRVEGVVGTTREVSWRRLGTPERMTELRGCIEQAERLAGTDIEKRRVQTWKEGVWDYMKTGHEQFYAALRSREEG